MRKVVICFFLATLISVSAHGQSPIEADDFKWFYVNSTKLDDYYWSPERRLLSDSGTVRFWVRVVLNSDNPDARQDFFENRRKQNLDAVGYRDFSHSLQLYEVDCLNSKVRILSLTDYNKRGLRLNHLNTKPSKWLTIVPDSIADSLAIEACPYTRSTQRYR